MGENGNGNRKGNKKETEAETEEGRKAETPPKGEDLGSPRLTPGQGALRGGMRGARRLQRRRGEEGPLQPGIGKESHFLPLAPVGGGAPEEHPRKGRLRKDNSHLYQVRDRGAEGKAGAGSPPDGNIATLGGSVVREQAHYNHNFFIKYHQGTSREWEMMIAQMNAPKRPVE